MLEMYQRLATRALPWQQAVMNSMSQGQHLPVLQTDTASLKQPHASHLRNVE